jgi:putative FmdB family regulatory protein
MPTYDYVCDNCGYNFEEFQSITAAPLTKCPKCRGYVRRLIGAGNGFLFKGNGFYITDYRSENYKKAKQNEEGSSSKSSSDKPSSKSEKDSGAKTLAQNTVKKAE